MRDPGGPAIVMALLLIETAIGGVAVLWFARLWGEVKWGFFKLAGATLAICALLGVWAASAPLLGGQSPASARTAIAAGWVFAGALVLWQVLLYAKRFTAAKYLGWAAVPAGLTCLIAIGIDPASRPGEVLGVLQVLAGALFAGAALAGLLLGHWHLVDRTLSRRPIWRMNQAFLAGCVAVIVTAAPTVGSRGAVDASVSPLLGAGDLVVWLTMGLAALCLVIGLFIRALIKEASLQSATGLFYLAVIMGFAAEFAAKVRFF
ncbi:MAG: hypothetical protein ACLGH3_00235 [Actinomycetota bacterium]